MKDVLIVVDYQNDFVGGALGFPGADSIDKGIAGLVRKYMDNDDIVIYTADTHYENYLDTQEGKRLPVKHCLEGTEGWQFFGETGEAYHREYETGKMFLCEKETFGSSLLLKMLKDLNKSDDIKENNGINAIESITLVGVVTNMCVISNAIIAKAACPEARIVIREDLCGAFDDALGEKAIDVMKSMQMNIEYAI